MMLPAQRVRIIQNRDIMSNESQNVVPVLATFLSDPGLIIVLPFTVSQ